MEWYNLIVPPNFYCNHKCNVLYKNQNYIFRWEILQKLQKLIDGPQEYTILKFIIFSKAVVNSILVVYVWKLRNLIIVTSFLIQVKRFVSYNIPKHTL